MDEMFGGRKHLHRLHQLQLILQAQGEWEDVTLDSSEPVCVATDSTASRSR